MQQVPHHMASVPSTPRTHFAPAPQVVGAAVVASAGTENKVKDILVHISCNEVESTSSVPYGEADDYK